MSEITKGQKLLLEEELASKSFDIGLRWHKENNPEYEMDAYILLLSETGKVEKEIDLIYFHNELSPCNGVRLNNELLLGYRTSVSVNLEILDQNISRIIMVLAPGKKLKFSNFENLTMEIFSKNENINVLRYNIDSLKSEKAAIIAEIYKHNNEWKMMTGGKAYKEGLPDILKQYSDVAFKLKSREKVVSKGSSGQEILKTDDGKFDKKYNYLIDLAKKKIKSTGIDTPKVQIVIAMDISFSMQKLFLDGVIQKTFDRILPLALEFDDDGKIDVWLFNQNAYNHDVSFSLDNRKDFVRKEIVLKYDFGSTEYSPIINKITKKYTKAGKDSPPVLVLFFTDGDCSHTDKKDTESDLKIASIRGIFWKFIGINSKTGFFESVKRFFRKLFKRKMKTHGFTFLSKLDRLEGRKVDNANFFHIDDLEKISDDELYTRMLEEFPYWLREAKILDIIN
jgi:stress response protein SCP2